ncbi:hypothetical protein [Microbispora sp. H13382]|uniref:hypothetical protein n=1 Tax=Microbispora sp. H13382 TaxID=2729112 RepID=UPI0015FFFC22|nr:hypothetical protein [Microbispora sp. H13382]
MSRRFRAGPLAAAGSVLSAIVGALVNILTSSWSWWIFAVAAALLSVTAVIAYRLESPQVAPGQTAKSEVDVQAKRGAVIRSSPVKATGSAKVDQIADNRGRIEGSGITADGAIVSQTAEEGGMIQESPIIAE